MSKKNKNSKANVGTLLAPITGNKSEELTKEELTQETTKFLAAPIEPQGTVTVLPTLAESVTHFVFTDKGVTVQGEVTIEDYVNVGVDLLEKAKSATVQCAHLLRASKALGKVTMPDGKESNAYDVIKHRISLRFNTESALANCLQLVPILDIMDKNSLTVSPFVVKEAIGSLRAMGSVADDGTIAANEDSKAIVEALTTAPKGVNAIRDVIKEAKGAKDERAKLAAIVTNHGGAPADSGAPAPVVVVAPKRGEYTPERIGRDLQTVVGMMEKASLQAVTDKVAMADHQKALRESGKQHLEAIALMMGLKGAFSIIGS